MLRSIMVLPLVGGLCYLTARILILPSCVTLLVTTLAISSSGTLYGVIASGLGVRETLLPVLFLPVLAPAVIGATRAFGDAFGRVNADGWAWLGLLSVIAIVYTLVGMLTYGNIIEDT